MRSSGACPSGGISSRPAAGEDAEDALLHRQRQHPVGVVAAVHERQVALRNVVRLVHPFEIAHQRVVVVGGDAAEGAAQHRPLDPVTQDRPAARDVQAQLDLRGARSR